MNKKKKMRNKALGYLLSFAIIISAALIISPSRKTLAYNQKPYSDLVNTTTVVYFDDKEWYIVEDNSSATDEGTVTLLSKECVAKSQFNSSSSSNSYSRSSVENVVNKYYMNNISAEAKKAVNGNGMFLLTTQQANTLSSAVLKCEEYPGIKYNYWWLCSPGNDEYSAAYVIASFGMVSAPGTLVTSEYGVRPAIKLNLESVIFSSESNTFKINPAALSVTGVSLDKTTAQSIDLNEKISFTATIAPNNVSDKTVKWSVGGTDSSAIKLYSDASCTVEISDDVTASLTVYAKGICPGNATITVTSNADNTKSASCSVKVCTAYNTYVNTTKVISFDSKEWYLIEDNSTTFDTGTVTLLSKECVAASKFNSNSSNSYGGSLVEAFVNEYYNQNISEGAKKVVNGNGMFLLTTQQANSITNEEIIKCSQYSETDDNYWWLSSSGNNNSNAACANGTTGKIQNNGNDVSNTYGVRPAIRINLESVIFSSETKKFSINPAILAVTSVSLDKKTVQTIDVDDTVSFTATVSPVYAEDKTVKWSVGGTDSSAIKLYSDASCTVEIGDDVTESLTVYAKGIYPGNATITVTSNADNTKSTSCSVKVCTAYNSYLNTTKVFTFDSKEWYLIEDNSTTFDTGTVTLLSKECVATSKFNSNSSNSYGGSLVEAFVNDYYTQNISEGAKKVVNGNGMFLLTTQQANSITNEEIIKCAQYSENDDNYWWLSSSGNTNSNAACANGTTGKIQNNGNDVSNTYGVRPAIKLNLPYVTFLPESNTFIQNQTAIVVTGISLDKTTPQTIDVDDTVSFTATIMPDDATDKKVKWSVSGPDSNAIKLYSDATCSTLVGNYTTSVDTVYVKGVSSGEATITVTSNADISKTASCKVMVNKKNGSINYETSNVSKKNGEASFINALTKTGNGKVSYVSDETSVATVDATTGEVTIINYGEANITATVEDSDTYTYTSKTTCYHLKIEKRNFDVTFNTKDHGTAPASQSIEEDGKVTKPADLTSTGYDFIGWYKEPTCIHKWDFNTDTISAETTIYAGWKTKTFTITWTNYNDSVLKKETVQYGDTPKYIGVIPTKPADVQYTYIFAGWDMEATAATENKTYKAIYIPKEIEKDDDKNNSNSGTQTSDATTVVTTFTDNPSKAAYVIISDAATGIEPSVKYTENKDINQKTVKIPDTINYDGVEYKVTSISEKAFKGNKTITTIIIGSNVKHIEKSSFEGCSKLKTAYIGSNVIEIGNGAFENCISLTKITIPAKCTKFGKNVFKGTKRLKTITIKSTKLTEKSVSKNAFNGVSKNVTIKVPKKMKKIYTKLFIKKGLSRKVKIK